MQKHMRIGDRVINTGDKFRANKNAERNKICREGLLVSFVAVSESGMVGLHSEKSIKDWGDCNGLVPDYHGYWASRDCILDNFAPVLDNIMVVESDLFHKNQSLMGMTCTILKNIKDKNKKYSFVEMEKNISGGSADGLGKAGHCILLPTQALTTKKDDSKKSKGKNKKEAQTYG